MLLEVDLQPECRARPLGGGQAEDIGDLGTLQGPHELLQITALAVKFVGTRRTNTQLTESAHPAVFNVRLVASLACEGILPVAAATHVAMLLVADVVRAPQRWRRENCALGDSSLRMRGEVASLGVRSATVLHLRVQSSIASAIHVATRV